MARDPKLDDLTRQQLQALQEGIDDATRSTRVAWKEQVWPFLRRASETSWSAAERAYQLYQERERRKEEERRLEELRRERRQKQLEEETRQEAFERAAEEYGAKLGSTVAGATGGQPSRPERRRVDSRDEE